jgi:sugar phosphate isomerase/epimerase
MLQAHADLSRLSLNQMTTDRAGMAETVDACMRHGIPSIGVWRHKLKEGAAAAGRLIAGSGMSVSSLCRGGMFPASTAEERRKRIEDNFRAVDEAAELGAPLLVLVNGPAPDRNIDAARKMVIDGIGELAEYAKQAKVKLGIEPLHPMFAADRSVVVTLEQANDIAQLFDPVRVGVVIDVYHVWWDPKVYAQIARARIFGFHVSDWLVPTPSFLAGRGMMGDGVIEIRRLRQAVDEAGYSGPIEVEIFNEQLWATPIGEVLSTMKTAFTDHV